MRVTSLPAGSNSHVRIDIAMTLPVGHVLVFRDFFQTGVTRRLKTISQIIISKQHAEFFTRNTSHLSRLLNILEIQFIRRLPKLTFTTMAKSNNNKANLADGLF